ncbi:MAG: cytochrome ubiquinol oxidase subunit I [Desulfobulbaceae bacterium]|nr:cytochrome ubiquinol oxidase subunit I [Candidatus Kapabacteria bacterium]MBS4001451.1 cytochrome ubiquinol oxidase subunit I [Desulfobulbaceae bacterium]
MDVEILSRLQFAFTIGFHYIFPPMSIGLGIMLVIMEGMYLRTGNKMYEEMTKFWVKIFALIFGMGVATGIVMEFQFGTNWATYSRFVGDVFGSALAAEGIFAFFLESGFLAILVFGWNKVSSKMHFFSTIMVTLGAHLSAVWIVVAGSWMHTPAGYRIVGEGLEARAEIYDFWAMVFNPSSVERLSHTIGGAWLTGAFLVLSVSAYYYIKNRHIETAKTGVKIALIVAFIASLYQLYTGHSSAVQVYEYQPAKLAAFEGHYETAPGDLYLFGWVDEEKQETYGVKIPGMLSFMLFFDTEKPVKGLNEFPIDERPPVNIIFQTYHLMVAIGMFFIGFTALGLFMLWRGILFKQRWYMFIAVFSILLPHIGNQIGWMSAEIGRQPWIVYGLLKTKDALSKTVSSDEVLISLVMFGLIYLLLLVLFLFLLNKKIHHGPEDYKLIAAKDEMISTKEAH